jgi:hypothetical protein
MDFVLRAGLSEGISLTFFAAWDSRLVVMTVMFGFGNEKSVTATITFVPMLTTSRLLLVTLIDGRLGSLQCFF